MTVFGFLPEAQAAVMREFARCGEILSFGSGREDKVNWVHIQFAVCCSKASPVLSAIQMPLASPLDAFIVVSRSCFCSSEVSCTSYRSGCSKGLSLNVQACLQAPYIGVCI